MMLAHESLMQRIPGGKPTAGLPVLSAREEGRVGEMASLTIRFNLQPATYAHPSWLPHWASGCNAAVSDELSRELLREHRLEADFDWTLENPAARFLLIDARSFDRLALIIGLLAQRDRFRQIVQKPQLQWLRSQLGDVLDALWLSAAETVERSERNAALLPFGTQDEQIGQLQSQLRAAGEDQLLRFFDANDPQQRAVALRAAFLTVRKPAASRPPPMDPIHGRRMAEHLIADIFPRWIAQWTWLF